jgi:hypothetical protein
MNMHPVLAARKLKSPVLTKLKAWRKAKLIEDPDSRLIRPMRITDAPRLYAIPWQTWHGWEQPPGHKDFKRPNDDNMKRLFEITGGEVTPADFYQVAEWEAEADSGG